MELTQLEKSANEYQVAIREAAADLRDLVEGCPASAWNQQVPGEGRTVGVLSHHIAIGMQLSAGWLAAIRTESPIAGALTLSENDERNRQHSLQYAGAQPADVVELLSVAASQLDSEISQAPAESIDLATSVNEMFGRRWTTRGLLEVSLRHITSHLIELRSATREAAHG